MTKVEILINNSKFFYFTLLHKNLSLTKLSDKLLYQLTIIYLDRYIFH